MWGQYVLHLATIATVTLAADITVTTEQLYNVTKVTYGANTPNYVGGKLMSENGPAMVKESGVKSLRWPGGNWANMIIWNDDFNVCPYFKKYANKDASWCWSHTDAATFAASNGLDVLWQMNAAVGLVCGPSVAADLAAAFVTEMTKGGFEVKFIEVGNENYGKWEVPYKDNPGAVSATKYALVCAAMVDAVKAVDPAIKVGCVGDLPDPSAPNTPFTDWNEQVLGHAAAKMDFLIIHEYFAKRGDSGPEPSPADALAYGCLSQAGRRDCGPKAIVSSVADDVHKFAPNRSTPLPIMVTEYNMEQPFGPETWELLEGLFVANFIGESMQAGIMGSTFFAMVNGKTPDYGMFSRDMPTPIAYAPVYAFALFKHAAPVGSTLLSTNVDPQQHNLTAFAFTRPTPFPTWGLVVVNTGDTARTLSVSGPWAHSTTALSASTYTLTATAAGGFHSTRFAWNGVAGPAKGGPYPFEQHPPLEAPWNGTVAVQPTSALAIVIHGPHAPAPAPSPPPPPPPGSNCSKVFKPCYNKQQGHTCCQPGCTCVKKNPYYSECMPPTGKRTC